METDPLAPALPAIAGAPPEAAAPLMPEIPESAVPPDSGRLAGRFLVVLFLVILLALVLIAATGDPYGAGCGGG